MTRMRFDRMAAALVVAFLLAACGGSGAPPAATKNPPAADVPQVVSQQPIEGATGITIDPAQKTVVIAETPSVDPTLETRLGVLEEESAATSEQVREQIESVGGNGVAASPSSTMVNDLETYKSQALESVKARQQLAEHSASGGTP